MKLRVPLVIRYLAFKHSNIQDDTNIVIDENDKKHLYISILNNYSHVIKTLIVKPDLTINIKYNEWYSPYKYNLSPNVSIHPDNNRFMIKNGNNIINEIKASKITKYVFNPHERIGAIVLADTSVFKRRSYAIIGFNDNSYHVIESPLIDVIPYVNGFIVAYRDGREIVVEKIPYGIEHRYDIKTNTLALYKYNNLISIIHDQGTLIIDSKNLDALDNLPLRNIIPLGVFNDTIILWNSRSHTVLLRKYIEKSKEKIVLICKRLPLLIGTIEDKILLSCSNNVIEVKNNNWRLHEISKKILGRQLISATTIDKTIIAGLFNKIIVWGNEKYYFNVDGLLGIAKLISRYPVVVDKNGIGIINTNKYVEEDDFVLRNEVRFDDNLRVIKRIDFNKNLIVSEITSNGNRVIRKKRNSFDIMFVSDKPVLFDIVYYGGYKVKNDSALINYNFKVLSTNIIRRETPKLSNILVVKYSYINPLDKDIIKPVIVGGREVGYIKLRKKSRGKSVFEANVEGGKYNYIIIGGKRFLLDEHCIQSNRYSINNIVIDSINGKILLLVSITAMNNFKRYGEKIYVCARGFINGCNELIDQGPNNLTVNLPITIDYSKNYVSISLFELSEQPYKREMIIHDTIDMSIDKDTISLITVRNKNKLYVIIDDLPSINNDTIVIVDGILEKHVIRDIPFLLVYSLKEHSRNTRITILQLCKETIYYSERTC